MTQEHMRDPWRLLLVEDDRELAGLLNEVLGDEGYAVDVAADGQRGLHLGLTRTYDVLVIDRRLPVVDGLDLLRRLRSRPGAFAGAAADRDGQRPRPGGRSGRGRRRLSGQALRSG
ncbi:response regulator [Streptomyces andamanensis]|uniref:Response regulator n=1 Tax=Streptomyces andamanensis TaxID=1565035 RepID=A0ABV8TRB5_9ACTN